MKQRLTFILIIAITLGGCATIEKYAKQGLDAADKAAGKYVDKKAGSGTYEDSKNMKDDKEKIQFLLPYYATANKLCDEKKLDEKKRDALKNQLNQYYAQWKSGKIQKNDYDKKCTDCIKTAQGTGASN